MSFHKRRQMRNRGHATGLWPRCCPSTLSCSWGSRLIGRCTLRLGRYRPVRCPSPNRTSCTMRCTARLEALRHYSFTAGLERGALCDMLASSTPNTTRLCSSTREAVAAAHPRASCRTTTRRSWCKTASGFASISALIGGLACSAGAGAPRSRWRTPEHTRIVWAR